MKQVFLSIFIALSITIITQAQTRWHVKADATGSNSGLNWVDAFSDLNTALNASQLGDSIWVAAGEYKPTDGTDRTLSFTQKSGTVLLGGFNGTEAFASQRNWINNPVLLSGDIGIIGDSTDNSFTILYMNKPDSSTILDGFSLAFGVANSTNNLDPVRGRNRSGGALYINGENSWAYADIKNCTFSNCYAWGFGGAVYVNGAGTGSVVPRFLNCKFFRNNARLDGGALYRDGGSWAERVPDFGGCVFEENWAGRYGAGLYYLDTDRTDTIQIDSCQFTRNGLKGEGGSLMLNSGRQNGAAILVSNSSFRKNRVSGSCTILIPGYLEKYVLFMKIENCLFEEENYTGNGVFPKSAVAFYTQPASDLGKASLLELNNCQFYKNETPLNTTFATSVAYEFADYTLCKWLVFQKNTFYSLLAANEIENSVFEDNLCNYTVNSPRLSNSTIIANHGLDKYTIYGLTASLIPSFIANCVFYKNTYGSIMSFSIIPKINPGHFQNCIFHENKNQPPLLFQKFKDAEFVNCSFDSITCADMPPGTLCENILTGLNPLFRDTAAHDYRLLPCSPLLNKGTNQGLDSIFTDLAGQPRILNGTVDIGAYETEISIENTATSPTSCAGAANGSATFSATACAPVSFVWPGGSSADSTLSGLAAGQYPLTITDSNGFSRLDTIVINDGPPLGFSLATSPVKCFGDSTGSASFFLFDATQPVDYEWVTSDSTSSASNLPAGNFGITATDSLGCAASATVEITQPESPLEAWLPVILPVDCAGELTGLVEAGAIGGTPDFQFLWSGGQVGPIQNGLAGGPVSVTVTDANGCTDSISTVVFEPQPIGISVKITHATGPTNADGQLKIDSTFGGTGPFQFIWSNGATGDSIAGLLPGDYVVSVIDDNGCLDTFQLKVDFIVKISSLENSEFEISLWPNPVSAGSSLILKTNFDDVFSLELFAADGKKVASFSSLRPGDSVPTGDLPAGSYFWKMEGLTVRSQGRLVVE